MSRVFVLASDRVTLNLVVRSLVFTTIVALVVDFLGSGADVDPVGWPGVVFGFDSFVLLLLLAERWNSAGQIEVHEDYLLIKKRRSSEKHNWREIIRLRVTSLRESRDIGSVILGILGRDIDRQFVKANLKSNKTLDIHPQDPLGFVRAAELFISKGP